MRKILALLLLLLLLFDSSIASAAPLLNTFERPANGSPYTLSQWKLDGWVSPWDNGMSSRTRIDGAESNHSGGQSLRVLYPKGRTDPTDSGAQAPFVLKPGREYYLSYWVRFDSDFSWGTTQFAGKLGLGLAGGAACSGGQTCTGYNGFSSRMIWRDNGQAAIYYYHMDDAGQYGDYAVLKDKSGSDIHYPRGAWINIIQRLKVNTVTGGQANPDGEIQVWYDGVSAAEIKGLRFVRNANLIDKAYFSSFFGGATKEYAPAHDSYIWYDDLKVSANRADICELGEGGCYARTFQAEDYTSMIGITKRPTTDLGGGLSVSGFDRWDEISFGNVQIPKSGTYLVEYRVASSNKNGKLSLTMNDGQTALGRIDVPNTGDLFSYRTVSHVVPIKAGTHSFGLTTSTGGFDINWWKITQLY